jgi:lipoic acid synthetase
MGEAKKKLPILPENPEKEEGRGRFPSWLHRKMAKGAFLPQTRATLDHFRLPTVCEEAKCPNLLHCWSQKTATFLALGKSCTRACGFCTIDFDKKPQAPQEDEPQRLSESVRALGLDHVVITMVARDDLEDGGALHIKKIVETVRTENPGVSIELLTSDFSGNIEALGMIAAVKPEIFNHNIETVRALTARVRHKATYERTLSVLEHMKQQGNMLIKSGFMVGLGETQEQVFETLADLARVGVDIVTIGQYLQPNRNKLLVKEFIHPTLFETYTLRGKELGLKEVYAGPFIRSSYNATKIYKKFQVLS